MLPSTTSCRPDPALHQLVAVIRSAAAEKRVLHIKGGGSKRVLAGYSGDQDGDDLDTRDFSGISRYDPSELFITARAGTPLAEVEAALAAEGQCLAFEPPHFSSAACMGTGTFGGAIASGLSGPARAQAGGLRDFVLGTQIINGRGELLNFGGQVMKNVAGYDLSRLMAGSWGSLAVITEATVKVMPFSPAEATLEFSVPHQRALALLNLWCGQPLPLSASSWQAQDTGGRLLLRLRGAEAAVASAIHLLAKDHNGTQLPDAQARSYWNALRNQTLPFFAAATAPDSPLALWRISVPQATPELSFPYPQLIEWHGGLRWMATPATDTVARELHACAKAAGGHARLFRAPESFRSLNAFPSLSSPLLQIHQRLKAAFDPEGVFAMPYPVF